MKILFVVFDYLSTPLGTLYLSSIARKAGHEVDVGAYHMSSFIESAIEYNPDIIAYSLITGAHQQFIDINRKLKEKLDFTAIFGGPHCTFFPEVINEEGVDAVSRGESEEAFTEFLTAADAGKSYENIPNWWIKKNGNIIENPIRALNEDLDSIPFPDRDLFLKFKGLRNEKTAYAICSRGCPYNCSYCFNHAFREIYGGKGKTVRSRSVDNVIEEIREVKEKFPLQIVIFQDDTFNLNKNWLFEFCEKFEESIGLKFHCHLRANLVTEEIVRNLKNSGCISIKMAIEAADEELRNKVLKRGISNEQILEACSLLKKYGIRFLTQNILGIPGGSLEKDLETLKLNVKIKPDYLCATLLQIYPKTRIGEQAKYEGVYDEKTTSLPASFFHKSVLEIKDKKKVERLRNLFLLIVEFPIFLPIVKFLISLPFDRLYYFADKVWKGYCNKHRIYPYKLTPKEYLQSLKIYFKADYY